MGSGMRCLCPTLFDNFIVRNYKIRLIISHLSVMIAV